MPLACLGIVSRKISKLQIALFLGGRATFPTGPVLLASVLNAPVVLFFGLYRGGRRYDVHFEMLGEGIKIKRSNREAEAAVWTQRYVKRLEHYTQSAPYNWFNFYDFWKTNVD